MTDSDRIRELEAEVETLKAEIRQLNGNQKLLTQALRETQQQLQRLTRYVKGNEHNQN